MKKKVYITTYPIDENSKWVEAVISKADTKPVLIPDTDSEYSILPKPDNINLTNDPGQHFYK